MKKITLDQLAVIVKKGFEKTEIRFEKSSTDLEQLAMKTDNGFQKSAANLEQLAIMTQKGIEETATKADFLTLVERVDHLEERMGQLEQRVEYGFDMIAQELREIRAQLKEFDIYADADIFQLRVRVDKIEKKLKTR